ncbi:MAG: hypothetical protein CBD37_05320 [Cyanobacteria bacterium TMED177]|nr:MAG: hypothetical protein CBD37_05320 [Cyanobacteria bacterium TMED177]
MENPVRVFKSTGSGTRSIGIMLAPLGILIMTALMISVLPLFIKVLLARMTFEGQLQSSMALTLTWRELRRRSIFALSGMLVWLTVMAL